MCFVKTAVLAALVGIVLVQAGEQCGVEKSSNPVHHNPWLVYIMYFSGKRLTHARCGGTLIDSRHVLTAAHCVKKSKFTHIAIQRGNAASVLGTLPTGIDMDQLSYLLKARLGEYDLNSKKDCVSGVCNDLVLDLEVEQIFVHPDYDGKEHDMAVLRLREPAPYTDFIRPVCLPTGDLSDDVTFIAAGWGIIPQRGEYSQTKKIIPLPYVKTDICQGGYEHTEIPKIVICAGGESGIDTCSGDSGGPLVWIKERIELWGVTSSGNVHCGTKGTPGIYMSVKDNLGWIKDVTSGL